MKDKNIEDLKKDLHEAIKSDPDAIKKIPDIIEVAIKRVAEIKDSELEEANNLMDEMAKEIEDLKEAAKKEQKKEIEEQKKEEIVGDKPDKSRVTPKEKPDADVGDQPKDAGEKDDIPKIDRATGEIEEQAKTEQEKEVEEQAKAEKEKEVEEMVKIAHEKGQQAAVEEITKNSTIGQALMAFEKIKEAVFPLIQEDINSEGFKGNIYNLLNEKEKEVEDLKKEKKEVEEQKAELEETMTLVNEKLNSLKEEIKKEQELEEKVKTVVESIDDPDVREKALEASKEIDLESFGTFKTLVETFQTGTIEKEKSEVLLERKEEIKEEETVVKTDKEKIAMMKKIAGI